MKNKIRVKYFNQKGFRFNCSSFKDTFRYPIYRNVTISKSVNGVCWWFDSENKWFNWDDAIRLGLLDKNSRGCSTHSREIRSVKAAIRHAKKHCELPIGTVLTLCSNFAGIGVEIKIIGKID